MQVFEWSYQSWCMHTWSLISILGWTWKYATLRRIHREVLGGVETPPPPPLAPGFFVFFLCLVVYDNTPTPCLGSWLNFFLRKEKESVRAPSPHTPSTQRHFSGSSRHASPPGMNCKTPPLTWLCVRHCVHLYIDIPLPLHFSVDNWHWNKSLCVDINI